MGRRRGKKNDEGVDLFSFLNIMAATIGVQTLLIVICALQILSLIHISEPTRPY